MMKELLLLLKEIKPDVDFINCDELIESGELDSLDIIEIIDAIETHYSIELDPNDIDPDNFQSLAKIEKLIRLKS